MNLFFSWFIENRDSIVTLFTGGGIGAIFLRAVIYFRKKDVENKGFRVQAQAKSMDADSALKESDAKTQNTVSELALELHKSSHTQMMLIFKLQETITGLEKKVSVYEAKIEIAETKAAKAENDLAKFMERYDKERTEWSIDRMQLVRRIIAVESDDQTRMDDTIPLPDLGSLPYSEEPPTHDEAISAVHPLDSDNDSTQDKPTNKESA
jgi:hypothetical protein